MKGLIWRSCRCRHLTRNLIRRILAKWRSVLCCAPAYLDTHAQPRTPADLSDHNCLLYAYSPWGAEFHFVDPAGNPVSARTSGNLISTSIVFMRTAVTAGLRLWLCPLFIVSDLLASGALVPLLPDYGTPEMEIVALYPHRRQLSTRSGCSSTCWSTGLLKSSAGFMPRPIGKSEVSAIGDRAAEERAFDLGRGTGVFPPDGRRVKGQGLPPADRVG